MQRIINRSFFIIKPEAFVKRNEIINIINKNSNLSVIETKTIKMMNADIEMVYLYDCFLLGTL